MACVVEYHIFENTAHPISLAIVTCCATTPWSWASLPGVHYMHRHVRYHNGKAWLTSEVI